MLHNSISTVNECNGKLFRETGLMYQMGRKARINVPKRGICVSSWAEEQNDCLPRLLETRRRSCLMNARAVQKIWDTCHHDCLESNRTMTSTGSQCSVSRINYMQRVDCDSSSTVKDCLDIPLPKLWLRSTDRITALINERTSGICSFWKL